MMWLVCQTQGQLAEAREELHSLKAAKGGAEEVAAHLRCDREEALRQLQDTQENLVQEQAVTEALRVRVARARTHTHTHTHTHTP